MSSKKLLAEQLLKSGLVSAAQAKSAKSDKRKQTQQQRQNNVEVVDEARNWLEKPKLKKSKDRELNQLRKQQEDQKQIAAQVKQLIELNRSLGTTKVRLIILPIIIRLKGCTFQRLCGTNCSGAAGYCKAGRNMKWYQLKCRKNKSAWWSSVIVFNEQNKTEGDVEDAYAAYQIPMT